MDLIDKTIKEMFEKGKSDKEIGEFVGRGTSTVQIRRRILGLKRKTGSPNCAIREELRKKIIELRKLGKPYREIAEELKINRNTVSKYCQGAGIGGSRMPRKKYLKVHLSQPHTQHSAFVISCGSFYLDALDVPRDVPLVAKVTPEKPNRLIMEIFERDKVIPNERKEVETDEKKAENLHDGRG